MTALERKRDRPLLAESASWRASAERPQSRRCCRWQREAQRRQGVACRRSEHRKKLNSARRL